MTSPAIAALRLKRSELAGEIIQLEKQATRLRSDLAHVDAALRVLSPGIDLEKIVPRRIQYRPRYFKRGHLTRLCLECLRDAAGPIAVADVLPIAIGTRTLNLHEHQRLAVAVYQALYKLAKRGTAEQTGEGVKAARWRLAIEREPNLL